MKANTFVLRLFGNCCLGLAALSPLGGAFIYTSGPVWVRVGDGLLLAISTAFVAVLLLGIGFEAYTRPPDRPDEGNTN
jgi:hypothetical protein